MQRHSYHERDYPFGQAMLHHVSVVEREDAHEMAVVGLAEMKAG